MNPRDVIEAFARALDRDDFAAARQLMAVDECVYKAGDRVYVGADDILESYRTQSARARELFDGIGYESEVLDEEPPYVFVVVYSDHLRVGDQRHTYRCRQRVSVDPHCAVNRILHQEIPEERVALDAFFERCGVDPGRLASG